jgi:excinuclease ABC subunit C
MISQVSTVDYILTKNEKEALVLEDQLIKNIKPRYNVMLKDDKTYPFLEITMGEKYPALVITRTKTKNPKSLYFGPFPNVSEIRVAKRIIDRIFLLRRCKEYKERKRPCLNYQMGKCLAPCTGNIDRDEYMEMVEEVIMFLSGKNDKLLERLRNRMNSYKDKQEYEQAAIVRDQIEKLEQLFPIVNFRKISVQKLDALKKIDPSYLLKEVLKMKVRPTVIEGFDISHTSANEAVGSMVYFKNGEPVKSNYRKFKIKQEETANDLKMLQEVVYRRLRRLLDENKKLPDILLIDGGRGQEAAARSVVRDLKIQDLRVLSLAKEKGNIYYKGRILKFENDSEVYKLFKRITDEAHRFAHSYHVARRKKQFIKK